MEFETWIATTGKPILDIMEKQTAKLIFMAGKESALLHPAPVAKRLYTPAAPAVEPCSRCCHYYTGPNPAPSICDDCDIVFDKFEPSTGQAPGKGA